MPLRVNGQEIQVGEIISKGAEGAIHKLPSMPGCVAKIYHAIPNPLRAQKLRIMATMSADARPMGAAWPVAVVMNGVEIAGFVMPHFENRLELHSVCAPIARKGAFPQADYRFLVAVAANLARVFATVHATGAVIGDVNERLALVDHRATVGLVDCDSFQIGNGDTIFTCDHGVERYQPPEMQGVALRGCLRTRNHDCFGLAVLIFQLLFFNRHPFGGVTLDGTSPSLGEAIAQYSFAWGAEAPALKVCQPPNTLPFSALDERMRELFERAFGEKGYSEGRPTARAWVKALDNYAARMTACRSNPLHAHIHNNCLICEIEEKARTLMFSPKKINISPSTKPGSARPDMLPAKIFMFERATNFDIIDININFTGMCPFCKKIQFINKYPVIFYKCVECSRRFPENEWRKF